MFVGWISNSSRRNWAGVSPKTARSLTGTASGVVSLKGAVARSAGDIAWYSNNQSVYIVYKCLQYFTMLYNVHNAFYTICTMNRTYLVWEELPGKRWDSTGVLAEVLAELDLSQRGRPQVSPSHGGKATSTSRGCLSWRCWLGDPTDDSLIMFDDVWCGLLLFQPRTLSTPGEAADAWLFLASLAFACS